MTKTARILIVAAGLTALLPTSQSLAGPSVTGAPVTVTNVPTDPAKTSSVDEPGRNPYQFVTVQVCTGHSCTATTPSVPAGKRLVIQHYSITGALATTGTFLEASLNINSATVSAVAPPLFGSGSFQGFSFDQGTLAYVDAGGAATVTFETNGSLDGTGGFFAVTGYLLDCSVNACAPIAP
jgi:hypothetical protein